MKTKLGLFASVLMVLSLAACGGESQPGDASKTPDASPSTASKTNSKTSKSQTSKSSTSRTSATSKSQEQKDEYYALPFNYYKGSTRSESEVDKWDKGFDYEWTFNLDKAYDVVTLYIGAQMSSSSHGTRTLFTNHNGADSSDSFESNEANDGTPRLSVSVDGVAYALNNTATYSECGLTDSDINYLQLTSFPVKAGANKIVVTTHASTGYRLKVGGEVRLYYSGAKVVPLPAPFQPGDGVFSNLTTFSQPQSILTDKMQQLIDYNGDYAALSGDDMKTYATGNDFASDPKPVHISWNHAPKLESYHYEVEVSEGTQIDEENVFVYRDIKKNEADLYNFIPGKTYAYRVKCVYDGADMVADVSSVGTVAIQDSIIRTVQVAGMTNCRDLGGKTLENGSKFKFGMIYRTGAPYDSQSRCNITDFGKRQMIEQLGIKGEIDLRGGADGTSTSSEGVRSTTDSYVGSAVKLNFRPLAYQGGKNLIYRNIEPIRKVFHALGDSSNYPVFFHCRIGTDRTGAIALLLNGLVGVSLQDIYLDYLFSNFGNVGKNPHIGIQGDDNVAAYVTEIQSFPGTNFAQKCYNFLLSIGVLPGDLNNIINMLTEGTNKTVNPNTCVVKGVADATLTGVSMASSSQFRSAPNYVQLTSESTKASFTVNAGGNRLIAKIASTSTSATIASALKVTIDGVEKTLNATSFATSELGLGGDYWIPAVLVDNLNLASDSHTIVIESKGTAVKLEQIALLA